MLSTIYLLWGIVCAGIYGLFLTAFCFWFLYLLQAIQRSWNTYKASMRTLDTSSDFQETAYNAKTEFVKNVFLFFLNIVELIAFSSILISGLVTLIGVESNYRNEREVNETFAHQFNALYNQSVEYLNWNININVFLYINTMTRNLFILSISTLTCLCIYLTSRYAQKSWIKSTNIRYYLGITVISVVVIQICTMICEFTVIVKAIHCIFEVVLFGLLIKHSRRLKMVISWTIVDLNISKTSKTLLDRLTRIQKNFVRSMTLLCFGVSLLILTDIFYALLVIFNILWDNIYFERNNFNFCKIRFHPISDNITRAGNVILNISFSIGSACIFTPYISIGLYRLSVVLLRRAKGQTGYQTRFKNSIPQ